MAIEPRPKFRTASNLAYLALLLVGGAVFCRVFHPMRLVGAVSDSDKKLGVTPWSEVALKQEASWWAMILNAAALAAVTVSVFELSKLLIQLLLYLVSSRRTVNQFFGKGSTTRPSAGRIILQASTITDIFEDKAYDAWDQQFNLRSHVNEAINKTPDGRFFKARTWVNHRDADGAREIVKLFRELNLDPPTIDLGDTKDAQFKFIMGLGFTKETHDLMKRHCASWLKADFCADGDVIKMLRKLVPRTAENYLKLVDDGDFIQLLPKSWNLDMWSKRSTDVDDYAIILRYTLDGKVLFVLAGFTENGTAAAGCYLASHWEGLHARYRSPTRALGDFLIVIHGKSHQDSTTWQQIPEFEVTPVSHRKNDVSSEWNTRL